MTDFPNRGPTWLCLVVVAAAAIGLIRNPIGVAAQTAQGPRILIPSAPTQTEPSADRPAAVAVPTTAPAPPETPSDVAEATAAKPDPDKSGGAAESVIQVGALRAIDPSAVGLLHAGDGGLGERMWAGTPRTLIERLIPRLAMPAPSMTMRELSRQLLLSAANLPADESDGEPAATSYLELRIERLAAAGDIDAVSELLRAASVRFDDPVAARFEIDARWLGGDVAGACELGREILRRDTDPYWLKVATFCYALDEQIDAARLAADLLREEGVDDEVFFWLVRALIGDQEGELESLPNATPLQLAMLRAARRPIPENAANAKNPGVLRAITGSPNASLEMRLAAAERAEAAGVLTAATLAKMYASVPFTAEERASALSIAEAAPGPRASALLYQVAQIDSVAAARAEALRLAWRLAREAGTFDTAARVNLPVTQAIPPTRDLVWISAELGRAMLAAGDIDGARGWFDMVRQQAKVFAAEAQVAVDTLWPLMQLADATGSLPWDPAMAVAWWEGTAQLPAERRIERATVLYILFDALGYQVPAALWAPLYDGPLRRAAAVPASALWHGLIYAAQGRRVGETVLLALLTLGEAGPAGAEPTTLSVVVAALRSVGLERQARGLAVEATLAHGF